MENKIKLERQKLEENLAVLTVEKDDLGLGAESQL